MDRYKFRKGTWAAFGWKKTLRSNSFLLVTYSRYYIDYTDYIYQFFKKYFPFFCNYDLSEERDA